ncbi:hypothetical protein T492DRAFT_347638 [Pavlovales sp. CCMP2436]|nr:hypothetical protein T492DRAFT_347638 [Pavlovales sp. CCMP2436]
MKFGVTLSAEQHAPHGGICLNCTSRNQLSTSRQYASLIGPSVSFLQATRARAARSRQHSPAPVSSLRMFSSRRHRHAVARELLLVPPLKGATEDEEEALAVEAAASSLLPPLLARRSTARRRSTLRAAPSPPSPPSTRTSASSAPCPCSSPSWPRGSGRLPLVYCTRRRWPLGLWLNLGPSTPMYVKGEDLFLFVEST